MPLHCMAAEQTDCFKILGSDNVLYGPVELPVLVNWVQEERVLAGTWIYSQAENDWYKASDLPQLKMFFADAARSRVPAGYDTELSTKVPAIKPGSLRRIKVFAGLSDEQLTRFLKYIELKEVKQFAEVVKQGEPGDAMYLILQGEVRARVMIGGKETLLAALNTGDFFGEISLFDHGPRSADVIANEDSVLVRLSAGNFQKMVHEAPDLAAPFLLAMGKTLTARIRADNKRYTETVTYSRLGAATGAE
jgi:CRP/FNR family transcriptional regulator, cyclic AMP receptor protein